MEWHWAGFLDHESGISKYHFGIGSECYSKEQLQYLGKNASFPLSAYLLGETTDTFIVFESENLGLHKISVIALNGAMEPSESACSSGVTLDITPPRVETISIKGARFTPSIICDMTNNTIFALNEYGIIQELLFTNTCVSLCNNESTTVDVHIFPKATLTNGTLDKPLDYDESNWFCHHYISFNPNSPFYLPHDNIDIMWTFDEPESQMLDYFVGLSSSDQVITEPDIIGFISTHNRTHFKCHHCGLGQSDEVYFNIKAINKANLDDHLTFGPVIVDFTPPVCTCALEISMNDFYVVASWPVLCCSDNEDTMLLTDYAWSLGLFLSFLSYKSIKSFSSAINQIKDYHRIV